MGATATAPRKRRRIAPKQASLVAACAVVVIGGLGDVVGAFKAPTWVSIAVIGLGVAIAAVAELIPAWQQREDERRTWRQTLDRLLAVSADRTGRLPLVGATSPYGAVGVSRSIVLDEGADPADDAAHSPYVAREIDDDLDRALAKEKFVLVSGDSKAGKSRAAFEALIRNWPDASLLVPKGEAGVLGEVLALDPSPLELADRPTVLWLDDLDRFLGGYGALDVAMLDALADRRPRVIVVATITSQRREQVLATVGEVGRSARITLERACAIALDPRLTDGELAEARRLYPDQDVRAEFAEQLVAGPTLERKYTDARSSFPDGWSVVQAAIDWRRAGLIRPIAERDLRVLFESYFVSVRADLDPSDEAFRRGLEWARAPVAAQIALLSKVRNGGEPSYTVFDYVVALADGQRGRVRHPIPDFTWEALVASVEPLELVDLGVMATSRGYARVGREAFERAARSQHSGAAAYAANELGLILADEGSLEEAEREYRRVADSGEVSEGVCWAANNLGNLLDARGDEDEAMERWAQAIVPGVNSQYSIPGFSLGSAREARGETEEAKRLYRQALASEQQFDAVSRAGGALGALLVAEGDREGGAAAYRDAAIAGAGTAAGAAAAEALGELLLEEGATEQAEQSFATAIIGENPEYARPAFRLGQLLESRGAREDAVALYRLAAESGQPLDEAEGAASRLRELDGDEGDAGVHGTAHPG